MILSDPGTAPQATEPTVRPTTAQPTTAQWDTVQIRLPRHMTALTTRATVLHHTTPRAARTTSILTIAHLPAGDTTVSELTRVAPIDTAMLITTMTDPLVSIENMTIPTPVPATTATMSGNEKRWKLNDFALGLGPRLVHIQPCDHETYRSAKT